MLEVVVSAGEDCLLDIRSCVLGLLVNLKCSMCNSATAFVTVFVHGKLLGLVLELATIFDLCGFSHWMAVAICSA